MDYRDYYKTLGVSRDANADDIRKSYRRLARKYHPDVSDDPNAETKFKEVSEAYEVLKDQEKRQLYDQLGSNWQSGQQFRPPRGWEGKFNFHTGTNNGSGFSDFFENFFSDSPFGPGLHDVPPHSTHTRFRQSPAQRVKLTLTLEQLHSLEPIDISFRTASSAVDASKTKHLKVKVPRGLSDGDSFRLRGQGENNRDLLVELKVAKHARFELVGTDVHSEVGISPWEAALGCSIAVETLGGVVQLKIPAGTNSGKKMRLKGRGINSGNHIVTLRIDVPSELTSEERELFTQLSDVSSFTPSR